MRRAAIFGSTRSTAHRLPAFFGGVVQPASGTNLISDSGLLSNLTIAGTVTANYLQVRNVSFASAGEIRVPGRLDVGIGTISGDVETLSGSGLIHLENGSMYDYNANVTLGTGMTIAADSGRNTMEFGNGFTNHGTINANGTTTSIVVQNNNTSTYFALPWQNQGLLSATNGGTLVLRGEIPVGGLGNFDSSNGTVTVAQKLFNDNHTLVLNGVRNVLTVTGIISGGTITAQNGASLQVPTSGGATFANVTLDSDVYLASSAVPMITGTTTLSAGRTIHVGASAALGTAGSLAGGGTVLFEAGTGSVQPASGGLIIGAGTTVATAGGSGLLGNSLGSSHAYVNNGTLLSQVAGGLLTIGDSATADTFTNNNVISVSNGSLRINAVFSNNGTLSSQNGVVNLGNITANTGAITLENSNVTITGVPAASLGNFSAHGGTLSLGVGSSSVTYVRALNTSNATITLAAGTFDNMGTVLPLQENGNVYVLGGATISGGTITSPGSSPLSVTGNGTLANVTVNADITLSRLSSVKLTGSTSGPSLISVGAGATVFLAGTALSSAATTIRFDGTNANGILRTTSGALTIPATVTVRTGSGLGSGLIGDPSTGTIINGTVIADTSTLGIYGRIRNMGTMDLLQDCFVGPVGGPVTSANSLENDAIISLSANADLFTYAAFSQLLTGTLDVALAGVGPELSGEVVTQTASLAGTLQIDLAPGYTPALGSSYTLLTATSVTGTFGAYNLPALPAGMYWTETYSPTSVVLTALPEPSSMGVLVLAGGMLCRRRGRGRG